MNPQVSRSADHRIEPDHRLLVNLITRRSQVQILPPPPGKFQVRPGPQDRACVVFGLRYNIRTPRAANARRRGFPWASVGRRRRSCARVEGSAPWGGGVVGWWGFEDDPRCGSNPGHTKASMRPRAVQRWWSVVLGSWSEMTRAWVGGLLGRERRNGSTSAMNSSGISANA